LITCGLGVPLPEDVPLITGGWLVGHAGARGGSLPLMIFTGMAGILIGDSIIFRAGAVYGEKLLETRLGRHISGERVQRTIEAFDGIAACVSAPAWVYLGWWARKHRMLNKVWGWSAQAQIGIFAAIAAMTVLYILFRSLRRRYRRKRGLPVSTPPIPLKRVDGELDRPASVRRP
jgi:membrane protein DedA with SNARE-associated domain